MNLPEVRARLGGSFTALLEAHTKYRDQAARSVLVDAKVAQAEQAALGRMMMLAQQQALLAIMESVGAILAVMIGASEQPNGGGKAG